MTKIKTLTVTVNKIVYRVTLAKLRVSDYGGEYGNFNHPELYLQLTPADAAPDDEWRRVGVTIKFQRNALRDRFTGREESLDRLATGYMDTARVWSVAYAGHVELEEGGRVELTSRAFEHNLKDRVRIAVARKLGTIMAKTRPAAACEAVRTVEALESIGVAVEKIYLHERGGSCALRECPNRGAAAALRAERCAQEVA